MDFATDWLAIFVLIALFAIVLVYVFWPSNKNPSRRRQATAVDTGASMVHRKGELSRGGIDRGCIKWLFLSPSQSAKPTMLSESFARPFASSTRSHLLSRCGIHQRVVLCFEGLWQKFSAEHRLGKLALTTIRRATNDDG